MHDASIEHAVSRTVAAAALVERALHDRGPWRFAWGDERFEVSAWRSISADGVTFTATFPPHCWLTEPEPVLYLKCDGEVVHVREQHGLSDRAFEVNLTLRVEDDSLV